MKRPLGITVLAIIAGIAAVHGLVLTVLAGILGITELLFGGIARPNLVLGGIAAAGLWKMRR